MLSFFRLAHKKPFTQPASFKTFTTHPIEAQLQSSRQNPKKFDALVEYYYACAKSKLRLDRKHDAQQILKIVTKHLPLESTLSNTQKQLYASIFTSRAELFGLGKTEEEANMISECLDKALKLNPHSPEAVELAQKMSVLNSFSAKNIVPEFPFKNVI